MKKLDMAVISFDPLLQVRSDIIGRKVDDGAELEGSEKWKVPFVGKTTSVDGTFAGTSSSTHHVKIQRRDEHG